MTPRRWPLMTAPLSCSRTSGTISLRRTTCTTFYSGFSDPARADVGCGAGRDTAWLAENGFQPVGFDASEGLLAEARQRHPDLSFRNCALPALPGVPAVSMRNVLCEAVIMHFPNQAIGPAVGRLVEIMESGEHFT